MRDGLSREVESELISVIGRVLMSVASTGKTTKKVDFRSCYIKSAPKCFQLPRSRCALDANHTSTNRAEEKGPRGGGSGVGSGGEGDSDAGCCSSISMGNQCCKIRA